MGSGNSRSNIDVGAGAAAAGVAGCPDTAIARAIALTKPPQLAAHGELAVSGGALLLVLDDTPIAELTHEQLRICVEMGRRYSGMLASEGGQLVARCHSLD